MNLANNLLIVQFSTLPFEDFWGIKRLGQHQPEDFNILPSGEDKNRSFTIPPQFKHYMFCYNQIAPNWSFKKTMAPPKCLIAPLQKWDRTGPVVDNENTENVCKLEMVG